MHFLLEIGLPYSTCLNLPISVYLITVPNEIALSQTLTCTEKQQLEYQCGQGHPTAQDYSIATMVAHFSMPSRPVNQRQILKHTHYSHIQPLPLHIHPCIHTHTHSLTHTHTHTLTHTHTHSALTHPLPLHIHPCIHTHTHSLTHTHTHMLTHTHTHTHSHTHTHATTHKLHTTHTHHPATHHHT